MRQLFFTLIYLLFLIWLGLHLYPVYFLPGSRKYIFIIGLVASWRYGWLLLNALRATFYKKVYFPQIRKRASRLDPSRLPEHLFIVITTYRIPEEISAEVYRSAIQEAANCVQAGIKATVVASVVEPAEENLVKKVWSTLKPPRGASLIITRFAGTGKRDGLAVALRALLKVPSKLHRSLFALVDGDSILTPGSLKKCAELFAENPHLGAVTTNEDAVLEEKNFTYKLYRQWYHLRFAQRDTYLSSVALSRRVTVLTGRMSVYRGELLFDEDFVRTLQYDYIEHWRIGWLRFLTGEDKSTWYYLLKNGWEMLYVPDVLVLTHEAPPDPSFIKGATKLMLRWFGNSLRATYRAMKLPPKLTTPFLWYMVRDQRITMWTGLYGLLGALLGSFKWGGKIFLAYVWWIMFTRFLVVLYYALQRGYYFISWPLLLYFNQIYGSLVKIYISSHLYRQKWTRQKTVLATHETWIDRVYVKFTSHAAMLLKILIFFFLTALSVGFFDRLDFINFLR